MAHWPFHRGMLSLILASFLIVSTSAQEDKKEPSEPAKAEKKEPAPNDQDKKATAAKQENKEAKKEEPKADSDAKKESDKAPAKSEGAADGTTEFNAKLTEWREILKELRTIRQKHLTASGAQAQELEKQWDELIAKGETLLPTLRAAGVKAYAASKDDRSIERFLIQILDDDIAHDRYEEAAALSKSLLEAGCEVKKVLDHAGVAAFCTNDFESAEKYLNDAKNAGVLGEKSAEFLSLLPDYKEFWKTEQETRAKEEAAKEEEQLPRVKITTTKGEMIVELFENEAPGAVGNFISLIEKKFYDGLSFHRVLAGFMAQGGCPKGDGTGGPGYNIYCEYDKPNYRRHFRGTLSMAHAGKDTGGSQFFITFVPTPHLNGRHTAFGRVIEGLDVLGRLQRIDPQGAGAKPEPDRITKMEVLRKRNHEYKPNKVQ